MKLSKNIATTTAGLLTCALGALPRSAEAIEPSSSNSPPSASADGGCPPGAYNVLVIMLDDYGTDQLRMYGEDEGPPYPCQATQEYKTPTPTLEVLRMTGVMFTRAYVNSVCSPTRACLMTGRYGMRTGVGAAIDRGTLNYTLPSTELFLPELIRDYNPRSYARGAFGKWHLSNAATQDCHPSENGFEKFQGTKGNITDHYTWPKISSTGGLSTACTSLVAESVSPGALPPSENSYSSSVARRDAATWINQQTKPFFAYVSFNPPHVPLQVPPTRLLSTKTQAKLAALGYEAGERPGALRSDQLLIHHAAVEAMDREIFELLYAIAPKLPRTVIIVLADNGTAVETVTNPAFSGHVKRSLHELGTRVPMIVSGPLTWNHAGEVCRSLVGAVDMWRTIANITGVSNATIDGAIAATGAVNDSVSFLDLLDCPDDPGLRELAYSELFPNGPPPVAPNVTWLRGMTDGRYRYIRSRVGGAIIEQLYDVLADECEALDLMLAPHVLTLSEQNALATMRAAMNAL